MQRINYAVSRTTLLAVLVVLTLLVVGNVLLTYSVFTSPYPGFNDFMTPWEASRSYFEDGLSPYSAETSLNIQTRLYGRAALPDEQPNHFAYPFYALFLTLPLIGLDYAWATAIWMVLCEICLVGAVLLLLEVFRWRPNPLLLGMLLIFSLFAYPGARGLVLGQVSHVVYFLQVFTVWAMVKDRQGWAGAALALSTLKPQMSVLLVPLVLLWALTTRRLRLVTAFTSVMVALLAVSFLLEPDWVRGFISQLTLYPTYIEVSTPAWVITQYLLNLGSGGEILANLILLAVMLFTWGSGLRSPEKFLWALVLTLTTTHLIGLRTASPHFVVFTIALIFYLRELARRRQTGVAILLLAALLVLPWIHFLQTLGAGKFEHPTVFLPLPLLTYTVLWLTRHLWWTSAPVIGSDSHPGATHVTQTPAAPEGVVA